MNKRHGHHKRRSNHPRNILIAVVVVALGGLGLHALITRDNHPKVDHSSTQSHHTYQLVSENGSFQPNTPAAYEFRIMDKTGATLKDFDTVHEKQMHLIVVRKDLANFQHLHPEYDASKGTFKLNDLTFPTDGAYRLFADFTPTSSQMGHEGTKLPVTLHEDVEVGDMSRYQPQPLGGKRLTSTVDGFAARVTGTEAEYYANTETNIPISFSKNEAPYTQLEDYLGALGHMVALSQNDLDFIHAHPLSESTDKQNGITEFAVHFPKPGTYKLFLQTQAEGKVITTDYVLTVSNDSQQMKVNHGGAH